MARTDVQIKDLCCNPSGIRNILAGENTDFKDTDHQTDTYFKVPQRNMYENSCT
jgi:adenylate cyclase class IV